MTRPNLHHQAHGPTARFLVCIHCADPPSGDIVLGTSFARRKCKRCGTSVEMTVVVQRPAPSAKKKHRAA